MRPLRKPGHDIVSKNHSASLPSTHTKPARSTSFSIRYFSLPSLSPLAQNIQNIYQVNLVLESAQVDYRPTMINLTHVINIVTKELMGTINAVSRVREALGDNTTSTKRPAPPSGNASTTTTATAAAAGAGNPSASSGAAPESAGGTVVAAEGGGGANQATGEGGGGEREGGSAAAAADPVPISQVRVGVQGFIVFSKP